MLKRQEVSFSAFLLAFRQKSGKFARYNGIFYRNRIEISTLQPRKND